MIDIPARVAASVVGRLGIPFTYYPPESPVPAPLAPGAGAVWHEAHQFVKETRSGVPITSTAPAVRVLRAHFPAGAPQRGGVIELAHGRFSIADIHELGGGLLLCPLHRSNP
jgi:hypothetical protein